MVFPNQSLTVRDPGLGVAAPNVNIPVISGIAFGGSGQTNKVLSVADLGQIREVIGYGPLAEDVALALQQRGGPVYAIIHEVTPEPSAPTPMAGVGPEINISGTPRDYYNVRVEIMLAGVAGIGRFRYSLDAFDADEAPFTWSATRVIPMGGTFAIPNTGLTLTFFTGEGPGYVLGAAYTYEAIPESPGAVDLAAVASLLNESPSLNFHLWLVSGSQEDEVDGAAIAVALGGHLTGLTQSSRWARGFVDVGSGAEADDVIDESEGWTSARVCPAYGFVLRSSVLPFEGFAFRKVSCVSGIGVRAMRELISTDLSRVASGPDEGVMSIDFDGFYDQRLDELKVSTMRTWPGKGAGFFFANAKLKSPFGSDFTDLQFGRVMDVACRVTDAAQWPFISTSLRTIETGAVDPRDAATIENSVSSALGSVLTSPNNAEGNPGHVSAFRYVVDLLHNLVTTGQLKTSVGIRPLGYPKEIITELFFTLTP